MYDALGDLISRRVGSHRELARRDTSGRLTRSTIGAILRHERSLSYDVLDQVLITCGISGMEREAWMDAWKRYGEPRRDEMDELRRAIAYSRLQPRRFASHSGEPGERGQQKERRESPYALELHVRGVIHIQAERLPPVIGTLVTSVISAIMAWLAAGGVH